MLNPALERLAPLIGTWTMDLYGASFLPDLDTHVSGIVTVASIQDGAAIAINQGDSEHPPSALWIVGRDEGLNDYCVLYSDDRGVSRVYQMSFTWPRWQMWRSTPDFSQRFNAELSVDGNSVKGSWTKSLDNGDTWEHDFNLDYIRSSS
jgi:hypothetical protein